MTFDRRAVVALASAGVLWGSTVPGTKLAVQWLPPGWLTVVRFGLAAAILLVACRSRLRAACSPAVLAWGAVGYGGTILVQNEGVMRTSVSHAALLVGATPVLVAIIAALRFRSIARPAAWAGYAVSLGGVCLVAGAAGGGATMTGDGLVLVSLLMSAAFTVAQTRLLAGRDPLAVTALQFLAATLATLPVAVMTEGMPSVAGAARGLPVTVALALGGTLLPFALFAFGQSRVSAAVAAPFLNLEPLVGAGVGILAFGDPFGLPQIAGAAAILAGIAVSSVPLSRRLIRARVAALWPAGWSGHEEHPAEPVPVLQQRMRLGDLLEWEGGLHDSPQAALGGVLGDFGHLVPGLVGAGHAPGQEPEAGHGAQRVQAAHWKSGQLAAGSTVDHQAAERGQQFQARGTHLPADAVQDDVDAVRSRRADLLRPVGIGVADAHVGAVLPGEGELVRRAGRGDDSASALEPGQLGGQMADPAGRGVHQHGLARGELSGAQHAQRHRGGHRQDARGAGVDAGGHGGEPGCVGEHVVGVGVRRHQCDYPLAHECRAGLVTRRLHGAHDVTVRTARQARLAEHAGAAAHGGFDVTGPDGLRPDQDLARRGDGDLGLLDPQDVGAAELVVAHSPHVFSVSHRRFDWPSQRWSDKRCSCQRWSGQRYQESLVLPTDLARLAA